MCDKTEEDKSALSLADGIEASEEAETAPEPVPRIKSHMAAAVLTTVFLGNWILGIPAIVFAKECELAAKSGQYEIAGRFSKRALTFLCVGSALSVAVFAFLLLLGVILSEAVGGLMYY